MNDAAADQQDPKLFLLHPESMRAVKGKIREQDEGTRGAWAKLKADADEALCAGPFSVVYKSATPPSGNKHDYMSMGPYWWPNPDTTDGLPYIRRDGEVNPERNDLDRPTLGIFCRHVETLALAYFFSGEEAYAAHAAKLLRTWFMDEETKMNPHLAYGQAIPGICDGRGIGIIESKNFLAVIEAVGLLSESSSWTMSDQLAIKAWFEQYLDWLLHSDNGRDEAGEKNNHGTHYDVQAAVFSLFVGRVEAAKQIIVNSVPARIASQIETDGRQPLELARTLAMGYSSMNLCGMFDLAAIGEHVGVDLWHYKTEDGRGLRAALDFLVPYFKQPEAWPYQQIRRMDWDRAMNVLRRGALAYAEPAYEQAIDELPDIDSKNHRMNLLFPPYSAG